jgi:hypothetical protein
MISRSKWVIPRSFEPFPEISFSNLKIEFAGYSGLAFWKSVCSKTDPHANYLAFLVKVASMLFPQPAGESVDEMTFSSSQRTLSKERSTMSQMS